VVAADRACPPPTRVAFAGRRTRRGPRRAAITAVLDQLNTDTPARRPSFCRAERPSRAVEIPSVSWPSAFGRAFTASGPGDERRVWVAEPNLTAPWPSPSSRTGPPRRPGRVPGVALLAWSRRSILLGVALATAWGAPWWDRSKTRAGHRAHPRRRSGSPVEPAGRGDRGCGRAVNTWQTDRRSHLQEREAAADLSHQLRTPLTVVQLEADSISDPQERSRVAAGGRAHRCGHRRINESGDLGGAQRPNRALIWWPPCSAEWRLVVVGDEQGRHHHITLPDAPCLVRVEQGSSLRWWTPS